MKLAGLAFAALTVFFMSCGSDTELEVGERTSMEVKPVINMGNVALGEEVKAVFTVKNTGDHPLILGDVNPSCGCTVPTWTKDAIAPGETGVINAKINTKGFSYGPLSKRITVTSNTTPSTTTLEVKLNIVK